MQFLRYQSNNCIYIMNNTYLINIIIQAWTLNTDTKSESSKASSLFAGGTQPYNN